MMIEKNIEEFIKDVAEDSAPVESKSIVIPKKDIQKNRKSKKRHKKRKHQPTGFICDDFEIMI